jgi:hypothetical protein
LTASPCVTNNQRLGQMSVKRCVSNQLEKALRLLESPASYAGLAERPYANVLLRIWRYPSFHPYSSRAIIEASKQMFLRRVTWDQSHTLSIEPVTFGSEVPVEVFHLEPLLAQLKSIRLPPFITVPTLGIDGTPYGIEVGSFTLSARLSWWETPPREWSELHTWHAQAIAGFEALLPASTTSVVDR